MWKNFSLNAVESHHIEKFVGYLEKIGLSKTSINIHLRTVKAMFNYFKNMDKNWIKYPLLNLYQFPDQNLSTLPMMSSQLLWI